jgi:ArsR family transcriptional regulator
MSGGFNMDDKYTENVGLFKALADPNRLEIVDMLSCGELCACMILEKFNITQPTLSHHMKILCDCGLVNGRKDGRWTYYSLNETMVQNFKDFLSDVTDNKEICICKDEVCNCGEK